MIIIQLTYQVAIEAIDQYLEAHRAFLDKYYQQGLLIASGPLNPRTGGIIIAASNHLDEVKAIFKEDPFALANLAEYHFLDFTPVKYCEALKALVSKSEGHLC
jgi:uncharacterized protein YciI